MSTEEDSILLAKNALMVALGDNWTLYLANMRIWFRKKMSKEEFDTEARRMMSQDQVKYHNAFLLAILNKIDPVAANISNNYTSSDGYMSSPTKTITNSSNPKKRKRTSKTDTVTFEPSPVVDFIPPEINYDHVSANQNTVPTLRYAVQELFLPDTALVMGRLYVGAWEAGLVSIEDSAAELIANSVQVMLKNILTAVITKRKHYRTTSNGSFIFDVGAQLEHPFTRNTVTRRIIDDEPVELDKEIYTVNVNKVVGNTDAMFLASCEELYPSPRGKITISDIYKVLQNRNIIPSHSVYSTNMERISSMLG